MNVSKFFNNHFPPNPLRVLIVRTIVCILNYRTLVLFSFFTATIILMTSIVTSIHDHLSSYKHSHILKHLKVLKIVAPFVQKVVSNYLLYFHKLSTENQGSHANHLGARSNMLIYLFHIN